VGLRHASDNSWWSLARVTGESRAYWVLAGVNRIGVHYRGGSKEILYGSGIRLVEFRKESAGKL
jgi:hypothetical protein